MCIEKGGLKMLPVNIYPYLNFNDLNLDWIIKHFKEFIEAIKALDDYADKHEKEIKELIEFERALVDGQFPPEMEKALIKWCQENTTDIIAEAIKLVFFGITDTGYFVAYIPESWSDIIFTTSGLDDFPEGIEYGRLILSY